MRKDSERHSREMDPNNFYCRTSSHQSAASSSITSATSPQIACGGGSSSSAVPEYLGCGSNHSSSGFTCKEVLPRNANSKSLLNQRGTNVASGHPGPGGGNSTSGYCSSNSSGNGNYINVMPVPMGTLQYHRRKLTPQEYQSRLYYNTTDYRCREDYYSMSGGGRLNTSSPSPSLQLQNQHHYQQQNQTQQQTQHHHHQQSHHHPQQQQQHKQQQHQQKQTGNHMQHPHQLQQHHQSVCSSNSTMHQDPVDEALHCSMMAGGVGGSGRMVAATQTHHSGNAAAGCEQVMPPSSVSMGPATLPPGPPPIMYTVHRVVTTAQIQTAAGNTFASSSSVSSVVSAVRNEADCIATASVAAAAASVNSGMGGVNLFGDAGNSVLNNNNNNSFSSSGLGNIGTLRNSPGLSTNTNYLQHQQKCDNTSEVQQQSGPRISNSNYNSSTSSTNANYICGVKSSSSIPRPLQNVIPTCVYLMSRVAVHMEIEGTAQCPTQVMLAAALGCEELGIANKLLAQSIFGLWMTSVLLEIQLKSHHRPYIVRLAWKNLLDKFSHGNPIEKKFDEPMIMLKRNVFFSKRDEEKIKDHRILELLYEEAKYNVLCGRYVMESVHSLMLGGIQARIELGPYNSHTHTISFFRENQSRFLPLHVAKSSSWSWLPVSRKNSAEVKLFEQFKRVPQTATTRKLMRKYLEFCWALPFYGAAFFHGQVEQPVRGLMSLVNHRDIEVIIAINERGIFIIDPVECTLLLGLRYENLSWDFAKPSASDDPECQTCIFIQFDAVENGIQISKLMQVFSKQAAMIDALISHFAEQIRLQKQDGSTADNFHDEPNLIQNNGNGVLCNKLSRLTLATFDEEGRCIGQMGSLSISY